MPGLDVVDITAETLCEPCTAPLPPLSLRVSLLEARFTALESQISAAAVAPVLDCGVSVCACDIPVEVEPEGVLHAAPDPAFDIDVGVSHEPCLPTSADMARSMCAPLQPDGGLPGRGELLQHPTTVDKLRSPDYTGMSQAAILAAEGCSEATIAWVLAFQRRSAAG